MLLTKPNIMFKHTVVIIASLLLLFLCSCNSSDVKVIVNWKSEIGELNKDHWAVNDYETIDFEKISDSALQAYSRKLDPSIVRVHQAFIADSYTDSISRKWDKEKIRKSFEEAMKAFPNAKFMLNPICAWPTWLADYHAILNDKQEKELIGLFVDFTRFVLEIKVPIHSIEIFNERETMYHNEGALPKLWSLYNKIAASIKQVDPGITIAGPALTWPKNVWLESFLDSCGKNTDILTWHCYYSGDPETATPVVINQGPGHISSFIDYIDEERKKRGLENMKTMLTEFNVQWVWEPFEIRHANNVGALFQAKLIKSASHKKIDGIMVWHLKGFSYGLINHENKMRATGRLYLWGNKYLVGKSMAVVSSDTLVDALAIVGDRGEKSVLVMNSSNKQLTIDSRGFSMKIASVAQLNDKSLDAEVLDFNQSKYFLPPYSVTLFSESTNSLME